MGSRRWDDDAQGRGIANARASLPAIHELADLAESADWVAEHPEVHLLPGLRSRIQISGLNVDHVQSEPDGGLSVRLVSPKRLTRREIRQSVWTILGGAVELSTLVRETQSDGAVRFEVVTGIPPGGRFATHGHTLRIDVLQPD